MAIDLGKDPIILISLSFLEILLILIPALIASKVEKKPFLAELKEMGFQRKQTSLKKILFKVISGLLIGIIFFLISGYIISFFVNFLVQIIFGAQFVEEGLNNAISTTPINPTIIQLIMLIAIQILVALCEEGFFRGFIIKKSHRKIKLVYSIIISSIIFSLYHVPPFLVPLSTIITFFGYYFSFGIFLSLTFVFFKNSLLPSSIAHFTLNILILLF